MNEELRASVQANNETAIQRVAERLYSKYRDEVERSPEWAKLGVEQQAGWIAVATEAVLQSRSLLSVRVQVQSLQRRIEHEQKRDEHIARLVERSRTRAESPPDRSVG